MIAFCIVDEHESVASCEMLRYNGLAPAEVVWEFDRTGQRSFSYEVLRRVRLFDSRGNVSARWRSFLRR